MSESIFFYIEDQNYIFVNIQNSFKRNFPLADLKVDVMHNNVNQSTPCHSLMEQTGRLWSQYSIINKLFKNCQIVFKMILFFQASDGWYWKWLSKWRRRGEELGITEQGDLSKEELEVRIKLINLYSVILHYF